MVELLAVARRLLISNLEETRDLLQGLTQDQDGR